MNDIYGWGFPVQASSFAAEIDWGINLIHWGMLVIFVLWSIFFTYLLVRYRAQPGVKAEYGHVGLFWSLAPDIIILVCEIALLVLFAIPSWSRIKQTMPDPKDAMVVSIVAEQFAWNIHYPGADGKFGRTGAAFIDSSNVLGLDPDDPDGADDVVTLNELHVPLGKPTLVYLTAKDVIHSFFIPSFRIKQDATPGLRVPLWFEATRAGKYEIGCAQLCGIGHANMRGDVYAESQEEFDAWLAAMAAEAAEDDDEEEEEDYEEDEDEEDEE